MSLLNKNVLNYALGESCRAQKRFPERITFQACTRCSGPGGGEWKEWVREAGLLRKGQR